MSLLLLLIPSVLFGEVIPGNSDTCKHTRAIGGGGGLTRGGWNYRTEYTDIRGFDDRPDTDTLNRVTVEWLSVQRDPLGAKCLVQGRLMIEDQTGSHPVNWFQGVSVRMANRSGSSPDWSNDVSQRSGGIIEDGGIFNASFLLEETDSCRDQLQSFEFAVSLARHAVSPQKQVVYWEWDDKIIPSSRRMLEVPMAHAVPRELELVSLACRAPYRIDHMINAANELRSIGKDRALQTLETFVQHSANRNVAPATKDFVLWLVKLTFESAEPVVAVPDRRFGITVDEPGSMQQRGWPWDAIELIEDIPLQLKQPPVGFGETGAIGIMSGIEWARKHGVIRQGSLVPRITPLEAAERVLSNRNLSEHEASGVRDQVLLVMSELITTAHGQPVMLNEQDSRPPWKSEWELVTAEARKFQIYWDAKQERFVAEKRP